MTVRSCPPISAVTVVEPVVARAPHPGEAPPLAAAARVEKEAGVAPALTTPVPIETSAASAQTTNPRLRLLISRAKPWALRERTNTGTTFISTIACSSIYAT